MSDARTLSDGHILEADLCIVGAGPAGITVAREFLGSGVRVCMLESGGRDPDAGSQALCDGTTEGDPYANPATTRLRQAGGTANGWDAPVGLALGVRYVPLDAIDFEERSWIPYSGWPIDSATLAPFYERAHRVCGLGPFEYGTRAWADSTRPPLPLASDRLTTSVYQYGLARLFTETYLEEISRAGNVHLVLHANAIGLETDRDGSRVAFVRAACLNGLRFGVRAKAFILASGGIENARLLLVSNTVWPNGLGNLHGVVGRYFMDHPEDRGCALLPRSPRLFEAARFYDLHSVTQGTIRGRLALTERVLRDDRMLNASVSVLPEPALQRSRAGLALKRLLGLARRAIGFRSLSEQQVVAFSLHVNLEQTPDPQNRIALGPSRDALGLPKVHIRWRWGATDERNRQRVRTLLTEEMERAGIGRVVDVLGPALNPDKHHHMGATRMHRDPHFGVVDDRCRVHGVANLFVAGSSVFPTSGFANPTLTIVALALRLGDYLMQWLAG